VLQPPKLQRFFKSVLRLIRTNLAGGLNEPPALGLFVWLEAGVYPHRDKIEKDMIAKMAIVISIKNKRDGRDESFLPIIPPHPNGYRDERDGRDQPLRVIPFIPSRPWVRINTTALSVLSFKKALKRGTPCHYRFKLLLGRFLLIDPCPTVLDHNNPARHFRKLFECLIKHALVRVLG
jgi:hypothetical protein